MNQQISFAEISNSNTRMAAQSLGDLLNQAPEYTTFIQMLKAANEDPTVQDLARQMQPHQNALQWGQDDYSQHATELARLELEMNELPIVQEYRQAEFLVRELFRAVDELISQEAGLAFAENAKRSGCCG